MAKTKYIKIFFIKAPPGTGYHAGVVHSVPEAMAKELIKAGYARATTPVLPTDLPHRDKLIAAGIETIDDLYAAKDLKELSGDLDEAAEKEIAEFLYKKPKSKVKEKSKAKAKGKEKSKEEKK